VGSLLTRAARRDLYQDDVNEGLLMRPGLYLTRFLVFFDTKGVDGAVGGWPRSSAVPRRGCAGFRTASCVRMP